MGRPPKADSGFHVSIHVANGYRYASTQPTCSVDENGRKKYRHIHWGRVDDGNRFIPGKAYLLASPAERARLVFPSDWDMSEAMKLSGNRQPGRPASTGEDMNRLYGDVWLLDRIADKLGIRKDLMATFHENEELVNDILTLAMFPILTGYSYRRVARWQKIARNLSCHELTPAYITRLTQRITEQNRMDFLKLRSGRIKPGTLLAVDSTSRSAYGESLADIHWGKNKEHLPLAQTQEVVAYSLNDHMPVYYRTFPGNMPDSRSFETILLDLSHAGFRDVTLVTDRGYESLRNIESFILKDQPMILCTDCERSFVYEKIASFGDFSVRPEGMEVDPELQIYYSQFDHEYEVKSTGSSSRKAVLHVNLYLDSIRRSAELLELDIELRSQKSELEKLLAENSCHDDTAAISRRLRYYKLTFDKSDGRLLSGELNERKVSKARSMAGFFSIVTHKVSMDAIETFRHYKLRDEQEKYFQQMKGQLGFDKQQNWSEEGKTGRLFILFVSLIFTSYVRHIWRTTELKNLFPSSLDILDEMRPIRSMEHSGKARKMTPFVGDQVTICKAFEIDIPEGCKPDYVSNKKAPKKRGRPRKPVMERET